MKDLFPETISKGEHGAVWWAGNWQCRNWHGYFQSREQGRGPWRFNVPWFSTDDTTCSVGRIDVEGRDFTESDVPIDRHGRITIRGRSYGRQSWNH